MPSTYQYEQEWNTGLADRLDKPQNWKDVCDVRYSNKQTIVLPYISTSNEPAVTANHLATAADRSDLTKVIPFVSVTQSSETLQILTGDNVSTYIDYADLGQSTYAREIERGELLGKKVGERIETIVLANHANWTNMGDDGAGNPGLSSNAFNISEGNIDNLVRGIIEQIQTANGFDLYKEKGGFCIWRPADWTKLVTFMQANGYQFADEALRDGGKGRMGKDTLGLFHYVSTSHASGHLMAGVRGIQTLGLLNTTFGKVYRVDHPASSTAGFLSGVDIYMRLDYGLKVQTNVLPVIYDVNVA